MCCSTVHNKSPKYKFSNCCGGIGIAVEVLAPVALVLALIASLPVALWSCEHFEKPADFLIGFTKLYTGPPGCLNSYWLCTSNIPTTSSSGSSSDSRRRLRAPGFYKLISFKKHQGEPKKHQNMFIKKQAHASIHTQQRKLLLDFSSIIETVEDAKTDYDSMKTSGKTICETAPNVFVMLIVATVFCIIQIVLSAVNACNCCYNCCGGYSGHQLCNGTYSIVSTVMAIIPLLTLSGYRGNVNSKSINSF